MEDATVLANGMKSLVSHFTDFQHDLADKGVRLTLYSRQSEEYDVALTLGSNRASF